MDIFVEKHPGFYKALCPKELVPQPGLKKIGWKYGLKFTGLSGNRRMSDGSPVEMSFAGYPWVDVLPKDPSLDFFSVSHLPDVYFRRPTSLVFIGTSFSSVSPNSVAVPVVDVWPAPGNPLYLDSEKEVNYLIVNNKVSAIDGLNVSVQNMTSEDYEAIGYRHFPSLGTFIVEDPFDGANTFPFDYSPEDYPGFKIDALWHVYTDGFTPKRFTVTDPALASKVHPLFGRFPSGTSFHRALSPSDRKPYIPTKYLSDALLAHVASLGSVEYDLGGDSYIAFAPEDVPSSITTKPAPARGALLLVGSSIEDVLPYRDVSKLYPGCPKCRFHVFGEPKHRDGYFCRPCDIACATPLDVDRAKFLQSKYSWFHPGNHLKYSDAELAQHDLYTIRNNDTKDRWSSLNAVDSKDDFALTVNDILKKHFNDDTRVICSSPFSSSSVIYKFPSPEILNECPDAKYEILAALRTHHPDVFGVISNMDINATLIAGDLAV